MKLNLYRPLRLLLVAQEETGALHAPERQQQAPSDHTCNVMRVVVLVLRKFGLRGRQERQYACVTSIRLLMNIEREKVHI